MLQTFISFHIKYINLLCTLDIIKYLNYFSIFYICLYCITIFFHCRLSSHFLFSVNYPLSKINGIAVALFQNIYIVYPIAYLILLIITPHFIFLSSLNKSTKFRYCKIQFRVPNRIYNTFIY